MNAPMSDEAPVMPTFTQDDVEDLREMIDSDTNPETAPVEFNEFIESLAGRIELLASGTLATYNPATSRVVSVEDLRKWSGFIDAFVESGFNILPEEAIDLANVIRSWLSHPTHTEKK